MNRAALKNESVCIEKYVEKQIQIKTREFIKKNALPLSDFEDIAQIVRVKVERRLEKFDPNLSGFPSFVQMIIKRELSHILQKLYAKKRGRQKTVYIEDIIAENKELGTNSCSEFFCFDAHNSIFEDEIREILDKLPEDLRQICDILKDNNVSNAAKLLVKSRGSIRNDIKKIKKILFSLGIKKITDII